MTRRPEVLQTTFAIGALVVGLLVYLLDRQSNTIYFMPDWLSLSTYFKPFFGLIGNYLPTFIHVYVLILLTAVIMVAPNALVIPICAAWFTIDSLLEVAQIPLIAQWISTHVPSWFGQVPFLDNTADYFMAGTFDMLDLCSVAAGTLCAYLTIVMSYRRGHKNDAHI